LAGLLFASSQPSLATELKLNHVQMKGTHNSYHVAPPFLPAWLPFTSALRYTHASLSDQLSLQGVRQFEFDVQLCSGPELCVFHIRFMDSFSTCPTLKECLTELKHWSDFNPHHHALFVFLEPKNLSLGLDFVRLENEITAVWPRHRILLPDEIQTGFSSLRQAIRSKGWPTVADSRGKAVFVLLDEGDMREYYSRGTESLAGRIMFTTSSPDRLDAAIFKIDDPRGREDEIKGLVRKGYMVRTRADADSVEPLLNDKSRLRAAMKSGAHMISTDYPAKTPNLSYFVELDARRASRCNPVIAPADCVTVQ